MQQCIPISFTWYKWRIAIKRNPGASLFLCIYSILVDVFNDLHCSHCKSNQSCTHLIAFFNIGNDWGYVSQTMHSKVANICNDFMSISMNHESMRVEHQVWWAIIGYWCLGPKRNSLLRKPGMSTAEATYRISWKTTMTHEIRWGRFYGS